MTYLSITPIPSHTTARATDVNSRFQQVVDAFETFPPPDLITLAVKPTVLAGGTASALTVTNAQPVTSYALGQEINFKAALTNTGATTVNVDGLGNIEVRRHEGSALVAGDLIAGRIYEAKYDGTRFQLMQTTAVELAAYAALCAASAAAAFISAGDAADEATAAAASAAAAAASAASIDTTNIMHLSGTETASGLKTFSAGVKINGQTLDTLSANGCSLIEAANYAAMRTLLNLVPGTDVLAMSGGTLTGALALAADPATALGAATKQYVDSVAAGLDLKPSARCATTANITLSGAQTIDGISAIAGDRVLVKDQSSASANGIYVVAAGAWTRATDMDAWTEVPGAFCFVEEGTANADRGFVCTSNAGGTIGSTAIAFSQFFGLGTYAAAGAITASSLTQATGKMLGRTTASTGAIEEIGTAGSLSLSSTTLTGLARQLKGSITIDQTITGGPGTTAITGFPSVSLTAGNYLFELVGEYTGLATCKAGFSVIIASLVGAVNYCFEVETYYDTNLSNKYNVRGTTAQTLQSPAGNAVATAGTAYKYRVLFRINVATSCVVNFYASFTIANGDLKAGGLFIQDTLA